MKLPSATRVATRLAEPPSRSLPHDIHRVVACQALLEQREQLRIAAVVGQQLERIAVDEIVLVVVVLLFELLDEERELLVVDGPDLVAGVEADQPWHGTSLPSAAV